MCAVSDDSDCRISLTRFIPQVEDTLFKINRQDFEQGSEVFRNMFDLPKAGESEEGSSTEHPLVLEGIRAVDLENFLAIMYARCVS